MKSELVATASRLVIKRPRNVPYVPYVPHVPYVPYVVMESSA